MTNEAGPPVERVNGIKHPAFAAARRLAGTGESDGCRRRFLVEGSRMLRIALDAGTTIEAVFWVDGRPEGPLTRRLWARRPAVPEYVIGRGLLPKLLGTGYETSIDLVAVACTEALDPDTLATADGPHLFLLLDEVQDPMNVGVLLRTGLAAGVDAAVLSEGTAPAYSRRAVRSSTGAILRLPVGRTESLPALTETLQRRGVRLVTTSADARLPVWEADLRGPLAAVVGNETHGVRPVLRERADLDVTIPHAGPADSLNVAVAAGILLFEIRRQRRG